MIKSIFRNALICSSIIISTSCGISKDVRTASISLVEKQKVSLDAHTTFHVSVISTLNMYLDAEMEKAKRDYNSAITNYHKAMLDELKIIYTNTATSEADKKVEEEKARHIILGFIAKAEENKIKKEELIIEAKNNLQKASSSLLAGEKAKSLAIEKLDKYLQEKRPSEKLLEMINVDLDKYAKYIGEANKAIKQAEPYIDKLKK